MHQTPNVPGTTPVTDNPNPGGQQGQDPTGPSTGGDNPAQQYKPDYGHNNPTGGTDANTGRINPSGPTSGTENWDVDRKRSEKTGPPKR